MVRQTGINRVNISWTPPPNPPSVGYGSGLYVTPTASTREVRQTPGTTANYWLIVRT